MSDEARASGLVSQVVAAEVRRRGLDGVVIASPPGPEATLLDRWLRPHTRVDFPDAARARRVADALGVDEETAWQLAPLGSARKDRLLVVHPAHKSRVLLEDLLAPSFPLGDLWGHQLARWCGSVRPPKPLEGLHAGHFEAVERALMHWLERGMPRVQAFAPLPAELAATVEGALEAGRSLASTPLIPKLTPWTLGIDPSP